MDLSTLDFAELLQLKNDVDVEVRRREVDEKAKAASLIEQRFVQRDRHAGKKFAGEKLS